MNREQKAELVSSLNAMLADQAFVAVTINNGLTVAEMQSLRKQMRAAGASFKVAKNRLARLALAGTKFENITDLRYGSHYVPRRLKAEVLLNRELVGAPLVDNDVFTSSAVFTW